MSIASTAARTSTWRGALVRPLEALRAVVVPVVVARAVVLGALGVAHLVITHTAHHSPAIVFRVQQGLLAWDGGFYESIARFGYQPLGHQALRFFPLFPLVSRYLASASGASDTVAVVLVANVCAFVGTAALWALVRRETRDIGLARTSAWLLSLAPPAFTFVLAYSEGMLLVATTACFLCLRPRTANRPRWLWAGVFGYLGALTRPLGVLLVVPALVEMLGGWRGATARGRLMMTVALAGPVAGLCTFLAWSQAVTGDFFLPLRVQTESGHHGAISDTFVNLYHDLSGAFHHHLGTAAHVPWVIVVVVLVVIAWFKLPASYSLFCTAVVLVAVTGTNLDSFERYALSAFPLVIVGAMGLRSTRVRTVILVLSGAAMFAYALAAFLNALVP
ncbi:MAG: hypothetical protein ACRDVP_06600 [Acidimicrobiales bacterium]